MLIYFYIVCGCFPPVTVELIVVKWSAEPKILYCLIQDKFANL